jgi:catechol 2,3-dioxygenase-like lactoylglutathione lyase family enzyme
MMASVDMKLEVTIIPVSDVDRANEFYSRLCWRLDADRSARKCLGPTSPLYERDLFSRAAFPKMNRRG